jgi:hypothetical protein
MYSGIPSLAILLLLFVLILYYIIFKVFGFPDFCWCFGNPEGLSRPLALARARALSLSLALSLGGIDGWIGQQAQGRTEEEEEEERQQSAATALCSAAMLTN